MRHSLIIPSLRPVRVWTAERTVDEELARRLIASQFPAVPLDPFVLLGEGWDNTVWLAGGEWVFRFPRREMAIPGFEREMEVLPSIAPRLPLPIPDPVWLGEPVEEFPWPWFGARRVPGVEPLGLGEAARRGLGRPFARFLRELHAAPHPAGLPADPMGRADMAIRVGKTEESLIDLEREGLWRTPRSVVGLLDEAASLPKPEPVALLHGDLHIRHLLVDASQALCGVIDFGDLCVGDPSIDMTPFWALLPPEGRREFLDEYGGLREDQLVRARVLSINLCAILAVYGHHEGMTAVRDEALAGLDRTAG
jgi:aminoglycoside phosphotransferase (APT) family kinase protein